MRSIAVLCALALLAATAVAGDGDAGKNDKQAKDKPPPPPAGIWWEADFEAGMQRATREGRPILLCVNALEDERANNELAGSTYRSADWGNATRGYVAFVCNPNDHGTPCSRYERHVCSGHKAALDWFLKRFGEDLITPQHVILEPDGDVAFRKEYYTGVVGPALLEAWLSALAPRAAYARAGIGREGVVKEFAKIPLDQVDARARDWLSGPDGLSAAVLLNVLDDCYDPARRKALIGVLRHTQAVQAPVLVMAAEERVLWPADQPEETAPWIATLFAVDRTAGVWAATRVLARSEDPTARDAVLRIWAGRAPGAEAPGIGDLPAGERPAAYEALLLAGDERARATDVPTDWRAGHEDAIDRALRKSGHTTPGEVELAAALASGVPGRMRAALVSASAGAVRAAAPEILAGLSAWRWERVRIAGALALLRAQGPYEAQVVPRILAALDDPLEGPGVRTAAVEILGNDPGAATAAWQTALAEQLKGGAK